MEQEHLKCDIVMDDNKIHTIEFYETKRHKWMHDIVNDVIEIVDTRPKNRFIVNRKSPYKEYIYNQYEGK